MSLSPEIETQFSYTCKANWMLLQVMELALGSDITLREHVSLMGSC